ncbi:MAG: porin [Alcaligenaceae bacterium]|nr:porin [Alcaligenaceae bacterium]
MKLKALAAGLALSFPMLASAQGTSVTLYGVIDTAVHYTTNIGSSTGTLGTPGARLHENDYTGFTTATNSWPSMWGLRGSEKISDGLEAVFKLESGFNPNTGVSGQGGRLFGREAWVGLKGDWGQIALGRQYSMLFWSMLNSDIMGPNAHGIGGLDNYIPDRRQDNAITYRGTFSGVTVGAHYAKGRDTAGGCGVNYGQENACSSYSAMLGYDAANWGVNVAWDVLKGSDLNPPTNVNWRGTGLTQTQDEDRRLAFNAWAKFDALKLGLVYINRKTDGNVGSSLAYGSNGVANRFSLGDRSDLWSLGAAYALTPAVTIDGSVNYINFKNAPESSKSWLYVARVKYALSKRTSVYASAAYVNNKGIANSLANSASPGELTPLGGSNQTAFMAGLRHNF